MVIKTIEQIVQDVKQTYDGIEDSRIYYSLKRLGVRIHVGSRSFKAVKAILAYYKNGFSVVTTSMLREITGYKWEDYATVVHRLGDYNLLILMRSKSSSQVNIRWKVHPIFLKAYYGMEEY